MRQWMSLWSVSPQRYALNALNGLLEYSCASLLFVCLGREGVSPIRSTFGYYSVHKLHTCTSGLPPQYPTLTYYSSYLVIISTSGNKNPSPQALVLESDLFKLIVLYRTCNLHILHSHTPMVMNLSGTGRCIFKNIHPLYTPFTLTSRSYFSQERIRTGD